MISGKIAIAAKYKLKLTILSYPLSYPVYLIGPVTSDDFVNLKKRLLDSRGIRGQSLLFVEWTRYAVRLVRIGFFFNLPRQWIQLSVVTHYLS